MKKSLLAGAVLTAMSLPSFAADMPVKAKVVAPLPAPSWTGFYIGANAGYGWDRSSADYTCLDIVAGAILSGCTFAAPVFGGTVPPPVSFKGDGGLAGVQGGYNYQFGKGVLGIEADYNWSRIRGSGTANFLFAPGAFLGNTGTIVSAQSVDSFGTVRGRLGWLASQQWLLYATGGLAYGEINRNVALTSAANLGIIGGAISVQCTGGQACYVGAGRQWAFGWTVGAGAEWALSANWSVKAEYLYINLPGDSVTATAVTTVIGAPTPSAFRTSYGDTELHVARVGINYKFGAPAPVVAKY